MQLTKLVFLVRADKYLEIKSEFPFKLHSDKPLIHQNKYVHVNFDPTLNFCISLILT